MSCLLKVLGTVMHEFLPPGSDVQSNFCGICSARSVVKFFSGCMAHLCSSAKAFLQKYKLSIRASGAAGPEVAVSEDSSLSEAVSYLEAERMEAVSVHHHLCRFLPEGLLIIHWVDIYLFHVALQLARVLLLPSRFL